MNTSDIKRLALIEAIKAEIKAMELANQERLRSGFSQAYGEKEFWDKADELRIIANKHDDEF